MGLSEPILAAVIGAVSTVTAAMFHFSALRARNKVEVRPKRGSRTRSVFAVLALMVASGAGGFLYSELVKQRTGEDMRAMRQELKELKVLIAQSEDEARAVAVAARPEPPAEPAVLPVAMEAVENEVESIVYVPACRGSDMATSCEETDALRIALCGTIPAYARVDRIELFAQPDAVQNPWAEHRAAFEQDLGGARFTGKSFEYAQADELKAVCVNFVQWSSEHPHIARILVRYGFGNTPFMETQTTPMDAKPVPEPAVIAADGLPALPNSVSLPAARAVAE